MCSLPEGSICKASALLPGLTLSTERRTGLPGSELGGENRLRGHGVTESWLTSLLCFLLGVLSWVSVSVPRGFEPLSSHLWHGNSNTGAETVRKESHYHLSVVWEPGSLALSHFVSDPSLCFAMGPAFSTRGRKSWHGVTGQHSERTEPCSSLGW